VFGSTSIILIVVMDDLQTRGSYLKNEAGKGDRARNCFTQDFRNNYDLINWSNKNKEQEDDSSSADNSSNGIQN
jgi:hypothetical protein